MKRLILTTFFAYLFVGLSAQTIGCQLATINDGKHHTETEPIVKRYNNILNQLDSKYIENKERIGDMLTVAKRELANDGLSEPLINIMEGINLLNDRYTSNKKFADNVTLYIILRHKGHSHSASIQNIQMLLNAGSMDEIMKEMGLR